MSKSDSDSEMASSSSSESEDERDTRMMTPPQAGSGSESEHSRVSESESSTTSSESESESEPETKKKPTPAPTKKPATTTAATPAKAPKQLAPKKSPTPAPASSTSSDEDDEDEDDESGSDSDAKSSSKPKKVETAEDIERKRKRREQGAKLRAERRAAKEAKEAAIKEAAAAGRPLTSTILNKHIKELHPDHYYHLGLSSSSQLKAMFGDVRFVIMSGSPVRAHETILKVVAALNIQIPLGCTISPIGKTERYSLYKAGPVISVSHGMGKPSVSIMLHEITKLLAAAGAIDQCTYIRVGTSGGLGVPPGSVIVSSSTVNGSFEPTFPVIVLGQVQHRPCKIDQELVNAIMSVPIPPNHPKFQLLKGITMATDDFYEGQGRIDGAICDYDLQDKLNFIKRAHSIGVRNIEMESDCIVAFCTRLNIKCAIVCATIVDRLNGDQVTSTPKQLVQYTDHAVNVTIRYIQKQLGISSKDVRATKNSRRQARAAKLLSQAGATAVPHVAGSSLDFPSSTVGEAHTGHEDEDAGAMSDEDEKKVVEEKKQRRKERNEKVKKTSGAPQTPAKPQPQANGADKSKNNSSQKKKPTTPAPSEKKSSTPTPNANGNTASKKKNEKPATTATPAKKDSKAATTTATPAASEKKDKKSKKPAEAETPKKEEKKENGNGASASKKKDKTPAPPAASTATPAEGEKPLNRRAKKKAADEAAAAEKAAAVLKALEDEKTIAAQRAADLAKFNPDAAAALATPTKVHRPTKNERKALKEAKIKEALANGTPIPTSAQIAAGFSTPVKPNTPTATAAAATTAGKKRSREDEKKDETKSTSSSSNGTNKKADTEKKPKKQKKEDVTSEKKSSAKKSKSSDKMSDD